MVWTGCKVPYSAQKRRRYQSLGKISWSSVQGAESGVGENGQIVLLTNTNTFLQMPYSELSSTSCSKLLKFSMRVGTFYGSNRTP